MPSYKDLIKGLKAKLRKGNRDNGAALLPAESNDARRARFAALAAAAARPQFSIRPNIIGGGGGLAKRRLKNAWLTKGRRGSPKSPAAPAAAAAAAGGGSLPLPEAWASSPPPAVGGLAERCPHAVRFQTAKELEGLARGKA